jgi:hypothetical protein
MRWLHHERKRTVTKYRVNIASPVAFRWQLRLAMPKYAP